jgi:hypothetical protein
MYKFVMSQLIEQPIHISLRPPHMALLGQINVAKNPPKCQQHFKDFQFLPFHSLKIDNSVEIRSCIPTSLFNNLEKHINFFGMHCKNLTTNIYI